MHRLLNWRQQIFHHGTAAEIDLRRDEHARGQPRGFSLRLNPVIVSVQALKRSLRASWFWRSDKSSRAHLSCSLTPDLCRTVSIYETAKRGNSTIWGEGRIQMPGNRTEGRGARLLLSG